MSTSRSSAYMWVHLSLGYLQDFHVSLVYLEVIQEQMWDVLTLGWNGGQETWGLDTWAWMCIEFLHGLLACGWKFVAVLSIRRFMWASLCSSQILRILWIILINEFMGSVEGGQGISWISLAWRFEVHRMRKLSSFVFNHLSNCAKVSLSEL